MKNWSVLRISHLIVSIILIGAAFYFDQNIFLYILGAGFLFQSLTNTGCSNGQCDNRDQIRAKYRRRH